MSPIILEETPGRTATLNGKEYLFFSGYAYLGINHVYEFIELVKEGLSKYGLLFPSSRISNTRLHLFDEFEALLSSLTGSEDTVCFSSGFTAGQAAVAHRHGLETAPGAHPAINGKSVPHKNFEEWSRHFVDYANAKGIENAPLLASDSVNALTAIVNDFNFLTKINTPVTAIIDDSHGIGLIGNEGKGISSLVPLKTNLNYLFTYSLSKAFGIIGGAVSCSKKEADNLRTNATYTAGTSISPAYMFAFIHAQNIYQSQRVLLQNNIDYFRQLIQAMPHIISHPQLPVFVLPAYINEALLFSKGKGILISSFAYPDVNGTKIQRVVLNALHIKADLDYLAACLEEQYTSETSS